MGIAIKGRLEVHKWKDENEEQRHTVDIVVERLIFLPKDVDSNQLEPEI
jgi:single-strand DNA-binding protein